MGKGGRGQGERQPGFEELDIEPEEGLQRGKFRGPPGWDLWRFRYSRITGEEWAVQLSPFP